MFMAISSNPTGSYFMGFKNNQVDRIKKGLFILAFAFCFMIRAPDLMDLSRKEVSVPFQALLLTWNIISLHFQVTLPGTKSQKGHAAGSWPRQGLFVGVGAHSTTNLSYSHCSLLPWYKMQHHEVPNANHLVQAYTAGEKGCVIEPKSLKRLFFFFFPFLPFPTIPWLFQTSSLPNEDMVKDHLSASSLPVSFPQFPLKGKPAVVGKSPKHLGTQSYGTRHRRTEASVETGRTRLHSSCCGHSETRLA